MLARLSIAVAASVALVAGATAAYWYWSPALAMQQIRAAAAAGDTETFNRYVDYPQLRANLRRQWLSNYVHMKMFPPDRPPGPLVGDSAWFAELEAAATESVLDDLLQPEAVMYAVREGRLVPVPGQDRFPRAPGSEPSKDFGAWESYRPGPNRYVQQRFKANSTPFDAPFGLEMERTNFATWRLVEIQPAVSM